jgi:small subunit ribosomal protein S4
LVRPNDEISVRPESRRREYFKDYGDVLQTKRAPDWISLNVNELGGRILQLPSRDQIEVPVFNEALIVEHYSR